MSSWQQDIFLPSSGITLSWPRRHLVTSNRSAKFEIPKRFGFLLPPVSMWKDFHQSAQHWKWICHRTAKFIIRRHAHVLFCPGNLTGWNSEGVNIPACSRHYRQNHGYLQISSTGGLTSAICLQSSSAGINKNTAFLQANALIYLVFLYMFIHSMFMTYETLTAPLMKRWLYHLWNADCTTYETLTAPLMKRWLHHLWNIDCTTYETLTVPLMKRWLCHLWNVDCTTYEALTVPLMKCRLYHLWNVNCTTYEMSTVPMPHVLQCPMYVCL